MAEEKAELLVAQRAVLWVDSMAAWKAVQWVCN
jgi:hypothetical protein